jgi:hypothetical protein
MEASWVGEGPSGSQMNRSPGNAVRVEGPESAPSAPVDPRGVVHAA